MPQPHEPLETLQDLTQVPPWTQRSSLDLSKSHKTVQSLGIDTEGTEELFGPPVPHEDSPVLGPDAEGTED